MTRQFSLDKDRIRILLLEGIHESAVNTFRNAGYQNIEYVKTAMDEHELAEKIRDVHIVGIRSRTHLTAEVLSKAKKLFSIGCFSIGTNQVNTDTAKMMGIPVFNAPFSNTRSVAELVIAESIMLIREVPSKNIDAHKGIWTKSASHSFEVRGKNI